MPRFSGPLSNLVPEESRLCVAIDDLQTLRPHLVAFAQSLLPDDSGTISALLKRQTGIDLLRGEFFGAGIAPHRGAILFEHKGHLVVAIAITHKERFINALKAVVRTFSLHRKKHWRLEGGGEFLHLQHRMDSSRDRLSFSVFKDLAIIVLPSRGKPGAAVIKELSKGPHGRFTLSDDWKQVERAKGGVHFLARPGRLAPGPLRELTKHVAGVLTLGRSGVELRANVALGDLVPNLGTTFNPASRGIAFSRLYGPEVIVVAKSDLDLRSLDGLLQAAKFLFKFDALAPVRRWLPKDPQLDLVNALMAALSGRIALVAHSPKNVRALIVTDLDAWLKAVNYSVALELSQPARMLKLLETAAELIADKPSGPRGPSTPVQMVPKLLSMRKANLRMLKRTYGGHPFYLLARRHENRDYGIALVTIVGRHLLIGQHYKSLGAVVARFKHPSTTTPAWAKRHSAVISKNHLLAGFLEVKNLVRKLVEMGMPAQALATVSRVRDLVFIIDVAPKQIRIKLAISL